MVLSKMPERPHVLCQQPRRVFYVSLFLTCSPARELLFLLFTIVSTESTSATHSMRSVYKSFKQQHLIGVLLHNAAGSGGNCSTAFTSTLKLDSFSSAIICHTTQAWSCTPSVLTQRAAKFSRFPREVEQSSCAISARNGSFDSFLSRRQNSTQPININRKTRLMRFHLKVHFNAAQHLGKVMDCVNLYHRIEDEASLMAFQCAFHDD
jgi:hypothetical protein